MNKLAKICNKNILFIVLLTSFVVMCFYFQKIVSNAFWAGLQTCYYKVLPSLFPILIVTSLITLNPLSQYLGFLFFPFLSVLGIKSKTACTAVLFGLIGGFSVFCNSITECIKAKSITTKQAELLLCTGINTGPAFIVSAVGFAMLNNLMLGVYLFISVTVASLICTVIMRFLFFKGIDLPQGSFKNPQAENFTAAFIYSTKIAVTSCINICGFIVIFNILYAVISQYLGQNLKLLSAIFLEVTLACKTAVLLKSEYVIVIILTALSFVGFSIIMQSKSLLPQNISFKYFFISRIFHLPISIFVYFLLSKLFPISLNVTISSVKPLRFTPSVSVIIIFMVLVMLSELTQTKSTI